MCPKSEQSLTVGRVVFAPKQDPCKRIGVQDLKTFVEIEGARHQRIDLNTVLPGGETTVEERIAEQERRRRQQIAEDHWNKSGVRLRHKVIPPSCNGPWDIKLKALNERLGTGILVALLGIRGCGKTQMAVELIRHTCSRLKPACYTTAMEIFVALRDSYKLQESEQQVLRRYQSPALLVIDEIQERGETAWEDRLLTAIIDYRYSQMRDTVLISNQTELEFKKSMGTSVSSRMTETGGIAECNWPSFRK
jgi:hypothetical protein